MQIAAMLLGFAALMTAQGRDKRLWEASAVTVIASSALDSASSWGRTEENPLLGPRFDARSEVIKSGIVAAMIGAEWLLRRKIPLRAMAWGNFGVAGATTGVAIRNWRTE